MKSDTPLDYAVFQLSPKRSRCELLVSSDGNTEKLASGLLKPFITHLKVAEEQFAMSVQSIKLEIERRKNAESWFTKGTLERFVRFVTTPEILELVNTFDAEMLQLESARRIYSQGSEDQHSGAGGGGSGVTAAADATKKELLRAIDVRLVAVQQDLTRAYARAAAAGFNSDTVPELQMFADCFGAQRLHEACSKFISLCERRPDLINQWKVGAEDRLVRSSYGSDMSIDEEPTTPDSGSLQHPSTGQGVFATQTRQQQENPKQSQPTAFQHSKLSFPSRRSSRESSVEPEDVCKQNEAMVDKDKKQESSTTATSSADQAESIQATQPARRLSVQDRVKLFENKQKESSGSGGKLAVGKSVELRRLSSDVLSAPTAVEKAVLRRWSGASDMSIDLSGEKKDIESPLCTPSSSQLKFEERKDTSSSTKPESRSVPGRVDDRGPKDQVGCQLLSREEEVVGPKQLTVSSGKQEEASEGGKSNSSSGAVESDVWKDQTHGKTQSRTYLNRTGINSSKDQAKSGAQFGSLPEGKAQPNLKGFDTGEEVAQIIGQVAFEAQVAGLKDKGGPQSQFGATASKARGGNPAVNLHQPSQGEFSDQKEDTRVRDQLSAQTYFKALQKPVSDSAPPEGASRSRIREAFAAHCKGIEGNSSSSQPRFKSSLETEEAQKQELAFDEKLSGNSAVKLEDSGPQRMKFEKQATGSEQFKKAQGRRDDITPVYGDNKMTIPSKMVSENQLGFGSFSTPPADHVQRVRQSKANQERNDELKMKANELEKLFAEHKLRVPGDQSNSTRRSRPVDKQSEPSASLSYKKTPADSAPSYFPDDSPLTELAGTSKNASKFNAIPSLKMVDGQNYSDALNKNFAELSFSEGSRGKFYERYMQKREAKLREEWSSKGAEKEAKLKAMQDTLEWSRAEMKTKFSGSTERQDSVLRSQRRAERLRSFNARSITRREQQQLDFGQIDDDEDVSDFPEQNYNGEVGALNETSFVDGLSRSAQSKKLLPTKSLTSSTPRTPAASIPKTAIRASNISSGRRKVHSDNPLAQSVPNFSELRKENTKPYSTTNRTTRQQIRNYSRSKSNNEEISFVREEKARRPQSLRKNSANPVESRDLSSLNLDGDSFTVLQEPEQIPYDRHTKTMGSKPIPKKGTGTDSGAKARLGLQKATRASEATNDETEYDDLAFGLEDPVELVKDEEGEEYEAATNVHHSNLENGEPELEQESENMDFGLENGVLGSFPQVDSSYVAELPASVPPSFNHNDNVQDSPGESPVSWNSRTHHPFSYSHEMSDIDASVDSPVGSPASWNSHSLSQTETDAARMRKKWGMAQKPVLVVNSSNNQSRKDMTRGFKRLLKFGRKSRGTESLVDWISATTSEGDDDTEDGRDPAYRSSEDLRKSRMGSSQGHPLDDSFNESEFYGEQVQSLRSSIPAPPANFKLREDHLSGSSIKAPRSFFSLSSFRSKGSDTKPR